MVFSLEVDTPHVNSVAGSGLLVHDDCPKDTGLSCALTRRDRTFRQTQNGLKHRDLVSSGVLHFSRLNSSVGIGNCAGFVAEHHD